MTENWVCLSVNGNELALRERLKIQLGRVRNNKSSKVLENTGGRTRGQVERIRLERKGCLFHLISEKEIRWIWMPK